MLESGILAYALRSTRINRRHCCLPQQSRCLLRYPRVIAAFGLAALMTFLSAVRWLVMWLRARKLRINQRDTTGRTLTDQAILPSMYRRWYHHAQLMSFVEP